MDSRIHRVLSRLATHKSPATASQLFNNNEASFSVVGSALSAASRIGLCDKIVGKQNIRTWFITDAGREALAKESGLTAWRPGTAPNADGSRSQYHLERK